jgi:hypothetical protein
VIERSIRWVLTNLPLILFLLAALIAFVSKRPVARAERFLAWFLLLPVGIEGIWAGVFHVFFPRIAASYLGWQVSPFQTEIGIADAAAGFTGVVSFWRGLEFKAAVVCYVVLFYAGVALVHLHDAYRAGNFAPGNFGALLAMTLAKIVLLTMFLRLARHAARLPFGAGGALGGRPSA